MQEFGDTGRGAGTLGMHVHVDVADDEEGVRVIDGLRPWLPLLTALHLQLAVRLGPRHRLRVVAPAGVDAVADGRHGGALRLPGGVPRVRDTLIRLGAALDDGMLYYDARLSASYPTVEIRVSDTCTEVDDAVLAAALARALVETVAETTDPDEPVRSDLLRAAWWRAARYGLTGDLVHPVSWELVPAADALAALAEAVAPALRAVGDTDLVDDGLSRLGHPGNGARRQRQAFERSGDLQGVVADLVTRTADACRAVTPQPARPRRRCSTGLTP